MEEQKQKVNIQDYIQIFLRRKWFVIIPFILISTTFFVSSFILPKIYEARAIILIEEKKANNPLLKNLSASARAVTRLEALQEEVLAWPRLFQLVDRLGLNKDVNDPLSLERLIVRVRNDISLKMRAGDIMTISYRSKNPEDTQKLVNTLCDVLGQRSVLSQLEDTESAIDFVNDQLIIYKQKLEASDASLRKFKEVYGSSQVQGDASVGITLNRINDELATLEADLVMASVDITDEHPRIKDFKRRIEALKSERYQYIQRVAEEAGVNPEAYSNIADSLPRQQEELARLTRDKVINEKIYAMFLERLETARITERLDSSENKTKFKVIEPARLPLVPIQPDKIKINILGLFLGLAVGLGLAYLVEYLDSSFKSAEQLKNAFNISVLGSISRIITPKDLKERIILRKRMWWVTGSAVASLAILSFIVIKMAGPCRGLMLRWLPMCFDPL